MGFHPVADIYSHTCYQHENRYLASDTNYVTNTYVTVTTLKPAIGFDFLLNAKKLTNLRNLPAIATNTHNVSNTAPLLNFTIFG